MCMSTRGAIARRAWTSDMQMPWSEVGPTGSSPCAYPKVQSLGRTGGTSSTRPESRRLLRDPVWMLTNDADAEEISAIRHW